MSSGAFPSDRGAPPARLFVVCGRGCAASELEALFAAFGVVRDVRYVEDKGVAYVEFSREDPFAPARALERFGANDDALSSLEGGVASCREFLGGCERTIRIMRADDHVAPAGTPSNSVSVSLDVAHAKEGAATADTARTRLAEAETGTPDRGSGGGAAAEDDPPRSRLFVVCPKNTSRETLRDAFEDLLVSLREEDEGAAEAARGDAAGDRGGGGDAAAANAAGETASDDRHEKSGDGVARTRERVSGEHGDIDPGRELESVHVVPHKGVAFAKFSSAEVARRCMDAVARAGTLGDVRVKCMLAEPKAGASMTSAGDNGGDSSEKETGPNAVVSTARPRVAREGSPSPGGSPKRRRAAVERSARSGDRASPAAFERDEGKTIPRPEKKRTGVRPRPSSPASSAESGGARRAATRARASRVGGAFEKSAVSHDASPSRSGPVPGFAAPPPPPPLPRPPPPGHPMRPPATFPILSPAPTAAVAFPYVHVAGSAPAFVAHASPPLPPGPAPRALALSPAASGSRSLASGGSLTPDGSRGSPSLGATSAPSLASRPDRAFAAPRVFVVLDKRATKAQLERAFRETCEGVRAVDLKKDARGASRGFAYVTFAESAHALAAAERLDGTEIPPGSGKRAKVMPAEQPPRRRRGTRGKTAEAASRAAAGWEEADGGGVKDDAPALGSEEHSAAALRRPREEEAEEDVSSWHPPPGKYPRVLAAGAAETEDEDAEVASSLRTASLARAARASWRAAEDEAGEAAAALGKVSLGTRGKASVLAKGDGEKREARKEWRKGESFGEGKGDARVSADLAEARATSSLDKGPETRNAESTRAVFFSLALPLPSYAVRHVLDAKGVVTKLHMSRDGASGWAEYADAEAAAAAAAALDGAEILGIAFRVATTPPEGDMSLGARGSGRLGGEASEGSERGLEKDVETSALETRADAQEGVGAKKRARIAATAGS